MAPRPTGGRTKAAGSAPYLDALAAAGPAGRPGTAEEIASAIVCLATDRAGFRHGAVVPVNGGRTAVQCSRACPADRSAPAGSENHWNSAATDHYRAAEPSRPGKDVPLYTL
ncbi:SDR family oxidoreductase [Streptomyces sp. NPDC005480]|uniref:SDR family oxidoreductase n=1 Tax=Streptomyces sp. NPDC005480 TaxID=3154880 RepID=UPI0033A2F38D